MVSINKLKVAVVQSAAECQLHQTCIKMVSFIRQAAKEGCSAIWDDIDLEM